MTDRTLDVVLETIAAHYPDSFRLTDSRLVYTVYLLDWRHALLFEHPATMINWTYSERGPWSDTIMDTIRANPQQFRTETGVNTVGSMKTTVSLVDPIPNSPHFRLLSTRHLPLFSPRQFRCLGLLSSMFSTRLIP